MLAFVWLVLASPLRATQDQNYGLGGATTGRVSGVTAELGNAFAALYNPALLSAQKKPLFMFSTGSAGASYAGLGKVLVDSPTYRTRDSMPTTEEYQPAGSQFGLWAFGFTLPFALPSYLHRRAGIGLAVSGPFNRLRSFSSGTPYDFSTLRYGTSDAQFKATASASVEIVPDVLYAGAGLSLYITAAGASDANIVTENPTGRLNLDVGLNTAAVAGLYAQAPLLNGEHHWALVYRQAVHPTFKQSFEGQVQVIRGTGSITLPAVLSTTLYYEPQTIEMEWQADYRWIKASVGVAYQLWSKYEPSYLVVEAPDADQNVRKTQVPQIPFHDTLNPRVSVEMPVIGETLYVDGGYQYRPSPIGDLSGPGNLLDGDTHVVGASVRYEIGETVVLPLPLTLSVHGGIL